MRNDNEAGSLQGIVGLAGWARAAIPRFLRGRKSPDALVENGGELIALARAEDWQGLEKAWTRQRGATGARQADLRNACFQRMVESQFAPPSSFVIALECGADLCAGFSPEAEARKEARRRSSNTPYARFLFEDDCSALLLAKRLAMAGAWPELTRVASWMGADPSRRARWTELGRTVPFGATVAHAAAMRMALGREEWPLVAECLRELGSSGMTFDAPLFNGSSALLAACGDIANDAYFSRAFRWDSEANELTPRIDAQKAGGLDGRADSPHIAGNRRWTAQTFNRAFSLGAADAKKVLNDDAQRATHIPLATLLLDLGADIEGSRSDIVRTPFLAAALAGDGLLVELLASRGANINASWKGDFAVHLATDLVGSAWKPAEASNRTLQALATLGLDLSKEDERGDTPKKRYCASRLVLSIGSSSPDSILAAAIGRQAFEDACRNDFDGVLAAVESEAIGASLPERGGLPLVAKSPRL